MSSKDVLRPPPNPLIIVVHDSSCSSNCSDDEQEEHEEEEEVHPSEEVFETDLEQTLADKEIEGDSSLSAQKTLQQIAGDDDDKQPPGGNISSAAVGNLETTAPAKGGRNAEAKSGRLAEDEGKGEEGDIEDDEAEAGELGDTIDDNIFQKYEQRRRRTTTIPATRQDEEEEDYDDGYLTSSSIGGRVRRRSNTIGSTCSSSSSLHRNWGNSSKNTSCNTSATAAGLGLRRVEGPMKNTTSISSTEAEVEVEEICSNTKSRRRRVTLAALDQLNPFSCEASCSSNQQRGGDRRRRQSAGLGGSSSGAGGRRRFSVQAQQQQQPQQDLTFLLSPDDIDQQKLRRQQSTKQFISLRLQAIVAVLSTISCLLLCSIPPKFKVLQENDEASDSEIGESEVTGTSLQWMTICTSITIASTILFLVLYYLATKSPVHSNSSSSGFGVSLSLATRNRVCESLEKFTFGLFWTGLLLDLVLYFIFNNANASHASQVRENEEPFVIKIWFTCLANCLHFIRLFLYVLFLWKWNSHKYYFAVLRQKINSVQEFGAAVAEQEQQQRESKNPPPASASAIKLTPTTVNPAKQTPAENPKAILQRLNLSLSLQRLFGHFVVGPLHFYSLNTIIIVFSCCLIVLRRIGWTLLNFTIEIIEEEEEFPGGSRNTKIVIWNIVAVIIVPYLCTLLGLLIARILIAWFNGTTINSKSSTASGGAASSGTGAGTLSRFPDDISRSRSLSPSVTFYKAAEGETTTTTTAQAAEGVPGKLQQVLPSTSECGRTRRRSSEGSDNRNQPPGPQPLPQDFLQGVPPQPFPQIVDDYNYNNERKNENKKLSDESDETDDDLTLKGNYNLMATTASQGASVGSGASNSIGGASVPINMASTTNNTLLLPPSSAATKMRRTSLPAALPVQRQFITSHHGGVDTAILLEAHGLVTDMLLDQAALPAHIVAGLKALATLLTPPPPPSSSLHYQSYAQSLSLKPRPAPLTLSTDPDYTSDIDEIPYTGEKISAMPKRNSGGNRKGVSANVLRRMSTSTWTTTTSATGMPTLEPQPNSRRRRSASFRSAMEGTPGSSPTQLSGLLLLAMAMDKNSSSLDQGNTSDGFQQQLAYYQQQQQQARYHSAAALHASHKSRSFSTNALFASSESRRRFSHQEFASGSCSSVVSGGASSHACSTGSRKTVCSLHPLSPSDVSYLNKIVQHEATEGGTGGGGGEMSSTSSSPRMTPYPSPIPSPKLSSRDNSPSNYNRQQQQRIITHRNSASGSSAPTNIPQQHSSATVLRHSFSFSPSNRQITPSELEALTILNNNETRSLSPSSFAVNCREPDDENYSISTTSTLGDSAPTSLGATGVGIGSSGMMMTEYDVIGHYPTTTTQNTTTGVGVGVLPPPPSSTGASSSSSVRQSPVIQVVHEPSEEEETSAAPSMSCCSAKPPSSAQTTNTIPFPGAKPITNTNTTTLPEEEEEESPQVIITPDGCKFDLVVIGSEPVLCRLNEWDYPIFDLEEVSKTQILSHMCYKIFLDVGLFETFKIPMKEFINYFHALELGYRDKPYHNRMHAADVLHGVYYFTSQPIPGFEMLMSDPETPCAADASCNQRAWFNVEESSYGIMGANFPALELMALYTAAAMHDYDHPGRTNAFLVTTNAPQAILYNDRSVLENHHAAAAWSLLLNTENCNFLQFLDKAEFKRFRYLVIEAILATDLKRHFEILAEFNSKVNEEDSTGIDWTLEADRLLVMEMCIKLADINGPCKYHDIHVRWTYRIAEEFYEQGDEEAELGLPISPYMDREHPQLAKLQESFINHLVAPLCEACAKAGLLPGCYWDEDDTTTGTGPEEQQQGEIIDEPSLGSCPETDNEGDSSFSDDLSNLEQQENKARRIFSKRKILCLQTKHLQDNHKHWMAVIKEENRRREDILLRTSSLPSQESVPSINPSAEDPMETIEEENNTPHSLNRSFSFEKEDSKL